MMLFFLDLAENRGGEHWTDHRENKPPEMSVDGQVDHLLDWVEVWVVQVPQEPQHTRPKHLCTKLHQLRHFEFYFEHLEYYEWFIINNEWFMVSNSYWPKVSTLPL